MLSITQKWGLTPLVVAMLLVGCNSNDDDPIATKSVVKNNPTTLKTLTVTPSLGKILNAKVKLKNAANNASLGETTTGTTGKATFNVPTSVTTVIAEVQGGTGVTYFDEAKKQMVDMPASTIIRAAASVINTNSEIGVTALTEAALQRAEALAAGGSIIPHLNAAKSTVEDAFSVQDILKAPTLVGSALDMANLGSSQAEQYALRLASLARIAAQNLGSTEAAPAAKMAQSIARDLADGDIDGSGNSGTLPYDLATFAAQYQAQVIALVDELLANASQQGFDAAKLQALLSFVKNNPINLTITPPAAVFALTGFTPITAQVGAEVTIIGTGFDSDKFHMLVTFSPNIAAEIVSATASKLVVKVPDGAVTGQITVRNTISNQSVTTANNITITSVTPPPTSAWSVRQSPSGSMLTSVSFGAGKFVAVGMRNAIISSTDGISWQEQIPVDKDYFQANSVIYDGTQFVMVGDVVFGKKVPPLIATSPDGITWTRRNLNNTSGSDIFSLNDVALGGGKLTTIGGNVVFSSSDNGVTWTTEDSMFSLVQAEMLNGVAGNANSRIVVGRDSSFKGFILRHDGTAWTSAKKDLAVRLNDVIWTGSQFVAVGVASDAKSIMTSADGITWTEQSVPSEAVGYTLNDVVWTGTKLYVVGDKMVGAGKEKRIILSSTDGITWTVEHESDGANFASASLAGIAASENIIVTLGGSHLVTRKP